MHAANARKRTGPAARGAFTLIELLIVLALIAVLVALAAGTVVRVIDTQSRNNTQTALTKIQSALNRRWSEYKDLFWKEDAARLYPNQWAAVMTIANNDPARARVIWVKLRQKQAFPISFSEALTPISLGGGVTLNPLPTYVSALGAAGVTAADTGQCQSAACLLLILQQSPSGGGVKFEDMGVSSSIKLCTTDKIGAVPGKQVNALVDGYGTPVQFCRWPTGSAFLGNSALGQNGAANDPGDPQGTLTVATWLWTGGVPTGGKTAARKAFEALCHPVPDRSATGPMSNRLVPLVISAGPDQQTGLNALDFSSLGTGADNDNIYTPAP
jgi:prepilin-type N-terminal cleavage/methylation domain-containing protein